MGKGGTPANESTSRRDVLKYTSMSAIPAVLVSGCVGDDDTEGEPLGENGNGGDDTADTDETDDAAEDDANDTDEADDAAEDDADDDGDDGEDADDDDYPSQDIRHIIPWGEGGGTDVTMRRFVDVVEENLPVDIYTENVDGASSGSGVLELMGSPDDGHTIGTLTWDSVITVPYFDLVDDYDLDRLRYVNTVTDHATILAAHQDSGYEDLDDLVAAAEENPGEISISNVGEGGVWHLPAVDFEREAGVEFNHVPFPDGAGAQREALVGQEVEVACISIEGILPAMDEVNILGVFSEEPVDELPDVPTFVEQGYDSVWGSFRVLAVPEGVPDDRFEVLAEAAEETMHGDEFPTWLEEDGGGGWMWRDGEETEEYIQSQQEGALELLEELEEEGVIES